MKPWLFRVVLVVAMVVGGLGDRAASAAVFLAGTVKGSEFVPAKDAVGPVVAVPYASVNVAVKGAAAEVTLTESLVGPEKDTAVVCVIPLPARADPKASYAIAIGPAGAKMEAATFLPAAEAQKLYESIARGTGSAAALAFAGRPALVHSAVLKDKMELRLTYPAQARDMQGVALLETPMPLTRWLRGPIDRVSVSVSLAQEMPLRAIFSPSHEVAVERTDLRHAALRYKADRYTSSGDLRVCYVADNDDLGLRLLTYRDEHDPDGYFMLVGNPTGSASQRAVDKDVIFVLDTSGSMRGEKIEQSRAAIEYCLGHLNRGDKFNIITFGTEVSAFKPDLVPVSPAAMAGAREFTDSVVAQGRTNISGALARGLGGTADPARPRIMIFLTDGTPTAGELKPEKILAGVPEQNTGHTRVFVMGVGNDVNAHLLDKLAEITDGSSEYVAPNEEIDVKVAALYDKLSNPVLTDVALDFGDLKSFSVYPRKLPALFKNSEVMVLGQYHDGGEHAVSIRGTINGKPMAYTAKAQFPGKPEASDASFIAPVWAARKVGFLLSEIRLHPDKPESNKELVEEVIRLSRKFGIVTEYTEFLAAAPDISGDEALKMAKAKFDAGRANEAGAWAVNQAMNVKELQARVVAAPGAGYRDRRGQMVTNESVQQVGNKAYYLRDGQWLDAEAKDAKKTRTVKFMSEEYLKLIRENAEFAKAQELSWSVSVVIGEERIVVEKDGKTRDETLKQTAPAPVAPDAQQEFNGQFRGNINGNINQLQQQTNVPAVQNNAQKEGK